MANQLFNPEAVGVVTYRICERADTPIVISTSLDLSGETYYIQRTMEIKTPRNLEPSERLTRFNNVRKPKFSKLSNSIVEDGILSCLLCM